LHVHALPTDLTPAEVWDRPFGSEEDEAPPYVQHGDSLIGMAGPGSLLGSDADMAFYVLGIGNAAAILWCMAERHPRTGGCPSPMRSSCGPSPRSPATSACRSPNPSRRCSSQIERVASRWRSPGSRRKSPTASSPAMLASQRVATSRPRWKRRWAMTRSKASSKTRTASAARVTSPGSTPSNLAAKSRIPPPN